MLEKLFFYNAENLLRIVISAPLLYAAVIAFVRISGKRSTSQLNNFDWVVTVAMGSLVASGIVFKDVTLLEVLLSIGTLLTLQYLVTRSVLSSRLMRLLVKAEPRLLLRKGRLIEEAMREERVTEGEVLSAIRGSGIGRLADVDAVILETDASLSVIPRSNDHELRDMTSLGGLRTKDGAGPD